MPVSTSVEVLVVLGRLVGLADVLLLPEADFVRTLLADALLVLEELVDKVAEEDLAPLFDTAPDLVPDTETVVVLLADTEPLIVTEPVDVFDRVPDLLPTGLLLCEAVPLGVKVLNALPEKPMLPVTEPETLFDTAHVADSVNEPVPV